MLPILECNRASPVAASSTTPDVHASAQVTTLPSYRSTVIRNVPHVLQKPDFGGEALAESWLRAQGRDVTQDQIFDLSGMDPERGMGSTSRELDAALRWIGFDTGQTFTKIQAGSASAIEAQFARLHADLLRNIPSIVCTHVDESLNAAEHFRLILGYDAASDEVIYHDSALSDGNYRRMKRERFLAVWPLKYGQREWTIVRLRLAGTPLRMPPEGLGLSPAAYAQHIIGLRQGKARGLQVLLERPFVVIGDGSYARLRTRAEHVVRWATTRLRRDFFAHDPDRILDIWLLNDASTYEIYARAITGESPSTPYGFYSSAHDALIMNIATGGGTLVHEIVHPYIEANFPESPAWFNEGLGSLFEQSADRDGHIVGNTNWRLAGLQRRIQRGNLPTFAALLGTTTQQFYGEDSGSNYAQARYLLYYLQERELLVKYYTEFFTNQKTDPTGLIALKRVLGESDLVAFQRRWENWILGLRFPE